MSLIECVPNFSEGRRPEVVEQIRDAIAAVPGTAVLDVSSDASHNRTVITFIAPGDVAVDAAFAAIRTAQSLIDLRGHTGEHPRIGATDVVPFVPLEGATMEQCIALARTLGERVGRDLGIPVYLYERAATRPDRENLADVRRGEFEGLRDAIRTDPMRAPDFGPAEIHASAGAVAIGARAFLVAYNVYLGPATNLGVAKDVAKAVRGSSGGLRYVKALGLEVDGQAQVSMNLVDIDRTPLSRAYELVRSEAATHGVTPTWSEIVGLVPERALLGAGIRHIQLQRFTNEQLLEHRIRAVLTPSPTLSSFRGAVAAASPTPGGGSVVAHVGALAAALAQMVAGLTVGRAKYAAVEGPMRDVIRDATALGSTLAALVDTDANAYGAVVAAYKLPKDPAAAAEVRRAAIAEAILGAAVVPLETARACAQVADLAAIVATNGNQNAASDAGVAALLAEAAARGAAYNVRINVAALADPARGQALAAEAQRLVESAQQARERAVAQVEKALGASG
jgi:glutamate formiminotransferase/formiminotetrahydrofolate cyclodeaminase